MCGDDGAALPSGATPSSGRVVVGNVSAACAAECIAETARSDEALKTPGGAEAIEHYAGKL